MKNFKKLVAVIALVALFLTATFSAALAEHNEYARGVTVVRVKRDDKGLQEAKKGSTLVEAFIRDQLQVKKVEKERPLVEEVKKEEEPEKKVQAVEIIERPGIRVRVEEGHGHKVVIEVPSVEQQTVEYEGVGVEPVERGRAESCSGNTADRRKVQLLKYGVEGRAAAMKAAWENNPWVNEWLAEKAAYEERAAKEAAAAEAAKKAEEEAAKSEGVEAETLTPAKFDWQKYQAERRAAAMKAAWENNPWVNEWLAEKAAYEERAAKEAAAAEAAKKVEEEAAKLEQWKKMTWWVTDSIQLTEGQSWLRTGATKTSESIVVIPRGTKLIYPPSESKASDSIVVIPRGTKLIYHPSESKVDEKGQVWVKVIYNGQVGWVPTKYTTMYTNKSVVIKPAKPAPIEKQGVYAETGSYLGKFWFDERGQIWYKVQLGERIGWVPTKYTDKSDEIEPAKLAPIGKYGVFSATDSTVLRDAPNKDTGKFVDFLSKYGAVNKPQIGVLKVDAPVYKQAGSKLNRNGTPKAGAMVYAYSDDWVRCKSVTGKIGYFSKIAF